MPNFSGMWSLKEQLGAISAVRWTGVERSFLYSWGSNSLGQLGIPTVTTQQFTPGKIDDSVEWSDIAAGRNHGLAITKAGSLWAWGNGGLVGDNQTNNKSSPVQIGLLTDWCQVSSGQATSGAIRTNNTMWTWGCGTLGRLGHNDTVSRSSPTQVGALTTWAQISNGLEHSHAVKTDGTLWGWGRNRYGRLGAELSNYCYASSPVAVGALTTWAQVSAGGSHSHAVKTDGTLWAIGGRNNDGQLGDNTVTNRNSPVQVGALTTWALVTTGNAANHAIKTDGTLWGWGRNAIGYVGDGTTIYRSSPVQIGALTNWAFVDSGERHSHAIKTDGTLWGWGTGSCYRIGDGTQINKSSPVQIGSSKWTKTSAGDLFTIGLLSYITN